MPSVTVLQLPSKFAAFALCLSVSFVLPPALRAQATTAPATQTMPSETPKKPSKTQAAKPLGSAAPAKHPGETASLEADQQRQVGKIYYADGHVDVHYENTRLRADHVEYNEDTQVVIARGNVQLDYLTQHVEADDARYEVTTGKGIFHHVR